MKVQHNIINSSYYREKMSVSLFSRDELVLSPFLVKKFLQFARQLEYLNLLEISFSHPHYLLSIVCSLHFTLPTLDIHFGKSHID